MRVLAGLLMMISLGCASAEAQGIPSYTKAGTASGTAMPVQCPDGTTSCFAGGGGSSSSPITPTATQFTSSGTPGTVTQVLPADSSRKDCTVFYPLNATGILSIYENGNSVPFAQLSPGGYYNCLRGTGNNQLAVSGSSTAASDTAFVTVNK